MVDVVRTITIKGQAQGIDELTGKVKNLAGEMQNVAVVSDTSAKRVLSLEDAWKKQTLKLDEAARSQANIARESKIADNALREGLITQQQHAERLNLITQRYTTASAAVGKFTTQNGLARHELINLGRQGADVFTQLASGQSLFITAAQQGPQILDVYATSQARFTDVVKSGVGWLGRFATSAAGVVTGIGAIAGGALYLAGSWSEAQREIDKALIGLGRRSGVTAKDINEIARTSATATGLSVGEARDAALEFVKTGAIYKDNIKAATDTTHNFAIVIGKDAKEAAQIFGAALADPSVGAEELNKRLGFLDGRTRELVITLANQNRTQEAQKIIIDAVAAATAKATDTLGPFEKAWAAVANTASRAKNALGAAISPNTDQDQLAQLTERRDRLSATGPASRMRGGVNTEEIARLNAEIERLQANLAKAAAAAADDRFKQFSIQADDAVKSLIPQIGQLQLLEKALADIKRAQSDSNVGDKQGLGGSNEAAARAAEVLKMNLQSAAEMTDRANQHALRLTHTYGTTNIEVAKQLELLDAQLGVAQSITGAQEIAAQREATIVQLKQQGLSLSDATAVADRQRAISLAQVNAEADRTLRSLQQEGELIRASSDAERDRIAARQTYDNLVARNVDSTKAQMVANQQLANAEARRAKAEQEASDQAIRNIKSRQDAWDAYARGIISWSVAMDEATKRTNAIAAAAEDAAWWANRMAESFFNVANAAVIAENAFVPFSIRSASDSPTGLSGGLQQGKQGTTQFNPDGYKFTTQTVQGMWDQNVGDTESIVNKYLAGGRSMATAGWAEGGGIMEAIEGLLTGVGSSQGPTRFGSTGLDSGTLQLVQQLTDLLPDEQKAGVIERELSLLRAQPQNIETLTAIKTLTDSLKQLTDATNSNTDALNAQLDPIFSQGHDYINSLKIGYYKAATGLSGIVQGSGGTDSTPVHMMLTPGEHVQVTPPGMMPRPANSNVSNNNSRNVTVTQNISIAETGPVSRLTARQRSQGFIAAAVAAAG